MSALKQQDIVLVDLDPPTGHEQSGLRPAVVVSSDDFSLSNMAIICPITTKVKHRAGSIIVQPTSHNGLREISEVLVSQIRTISQQRIIKRIGKISEQQLLEIFSNFDLLLNR